MNTLAKTPNIVPQSINVDSLIQSFLSGRKATTIEAYRRDLHQFREFLNLDSLNLAATHLISLPHGHANGLALSYKSHLTDTLKLQSATVNRRLAALRSLVKLARIMGLVSWRLEIENRKHESYRDVSGIGIDSIRAIFLFLQSKADKKSVRDHAIFRLLFDLGLRREEVCSLELVDLAVDRATLSVLGKGKSQKQKVCLPQPTVDALKNWIAIRGTTDGPLFFRLDKARIGKLKRLTGTGLYSIIQDLGRKSGVRNITVHKIRHDSITAALREAAENNIGLDDVRKFSRHSDIKTLLIYKDDTDNAQGRLAALVAKKVG